MEKNRLQQLLIDQKNELSKRVEKIGIDLKNRRVNRTVSSQNIDHSNDDVLAVLEEEAHTKLELTQKALQRLKEGEFGHCLQCGNDINDERLEALPHTQVCRVCAKEGERIDNRSAANTHILSDV